MTTTEKAMVELGKIVKLFSSQELHNKIATVYIKTAGKPMQRWSIGNQLLGLLAETTDGRTFNAWKQLGRSVKKGSKAFYILQPIQIMVPLVDKDGKPIIDETGQQKKGLRLVGFQASPRFRYEDTEGQELEAFTPKALPPLLEVAEKWGIALKYDNTTRGEEGYFEPSTNTIVLCTENPSVFFHELAHKAHSKIENIKTGQDPEQETIAELTAATLSSLYGYDVKAASYDYIAHYAKDHKPQSVGQMCLKVLDKVRRVLDLILTTQEETAKIEQEVKA